MIAYALNIQTQTLVEIKKIEEETVVVVHPFTGKDVEVPKNLYDLLVSSPKILQDAEESARKNSIERSLKNPERVIEHVQFDGYEIKINQKVLSLIEEYKKLNLGDEKELLRKEILENISGREKVNYSTFGGCYV